MSNDIKHLLIDYFNKSYDILDLLSSLTHNEKESLEEIISRAGSNKGVYTVLITLALYKCVKPSQDIRNHKKELPNGFSGRSFDTKYVTPTLKELGLPAMSESGWLTRSLEQVHPYNMNFMGNITPSSLKTAFLMTVAKIQNSKGDAETVLRILLNGGIAYRNNNKVQINKIDNVEVQISAILSLLREHFTAFYATHGGSKLPVLAFYAVYTMIINEMDRYKGAELLKLGSHTASDKTSRSAGDIEVAKEGRIFEAVEVKLNKPITVHLIRLAYEKINKFSVSRYYILSGIDVAPEDSEEINELILKIR
jgi:DNA (cytosine-5)-methyltransferase 1